MTAAYKQTEAGLIPNDWECVPVGQLVAEGVLAKPLDGNHGEIHPKSGDFVSFGIPFVMANNVRGGSVDLNDCAFIRKEQADSLLKGFSLTGDVLLTHKATIGQTAVVGDIPYDYIMLTPQVTYYRITDPERMSNFYLRQFFEGNSFQRVLQAMSGGGTRSYIGITAQLDLTIAFPRQVTEQRTIATALSDVDALLAKLDQLIAKKRDIKQAAMQQLLTRQTRLPGYSGVWETKAIKNIVQIPVTDGPHLTPDFLDDGIPFLSVNNLVNNKIDLNDLRFISRADHEIFSQKCRPRRGDVLLGKAASVGKVAIVDLDIEFNIWSPIALIRVGGGNVPRFIYYQLQSNDLLRQITLLTNSSSQGNIGMGDIEKLTLPLPSKEEQAEIAKVLSDMDADIAALEFRRDKTRALKQGMMQELLTGRIRLV